MIDQIYEGIIESLKKGGAPRQKRPEDDKKNGQNLFQKIMLRNVQEPSEIESLIKLMQDG